MYLLFRLVGGLASENVRWAQSVEAFREQEKMLTGNVLVITGSQWPRGINPGLSFKTYQTQLQVLCDFTRHLCISSIPQSLQSCAGPDSYEL